MEAHPTRQFVLQILRLIVWTIIAVALVKFAFFPAQQDDESIHGQGVFELPTVTVTRGSIENTQTFPAAIARDDTKTFKATAEGVIVKFFVADGASVGEGDRLLQIRSEKTTTPTDPEEAPRTSYSYSNVRAPIAGTVHFDTIEGQAASIGDSLGSIQPARFHASVQLTPDKLYSLQGLPKTAKIIITDGPAPFECTDLHITTVTSTTQGESGATAQTSSPEMRCAIPADQTVFDGLKAKLTISGESVADTLMLPITAIEGRYREGNVYLPAKQPGGKPKPVKVKIGINDGSFVQITDGLKEGAAVLEFVPSIDPDEQDKAEARDAAGV